MYLMLCYSQKNFNQSLMAWKPPNAIDVTWNIFSEIRSLIRYFGSSLSIFLNKQVYYKTPITTNTRKWWWSDLECDVLIWWITTSTHLWPSKNILIIYPHNTKPSCLCQKIRYIPKLQKATMDEMKSDTGNKSKNGKDLAPGAHKLDPHLPPKRLDYLCLVAI